MSAKNKLKDFSASFCMYGMDVCEYTMTYCKKLEATLLLFILHLVQE
jgi:hypothetical protein